MDLSVKSFDELTTKQLYEIIKSRQEIFLLEQNIICQDLDDVDYTSLHFYMWDNNRVVGYLRAFGVQKDVVKIGRVLTLHHGKGIGRELMEKSLPQIVEKFKCKKICMNSQKQAVGFYERFGFKVTSDEFLEEGVVHLRMELDVLN